MALIINKDDLVTRTEFDRLYDEAYSYLSVERQRLGENMRETLWETLEQEDTFIHRYELDGYLVGCGALTSLDIKFEGKVEKWAWYRQPTYGVSESGSRSWWYSEDFQKIAREWCDADGYDRVMAIHHPTSPAALAVANTWGNSWDGRQYFERPEVYTLDEVFGDSRWRLLVPDNMHVFLIDKHEDNTDTGDNNGEN